MSTKTDTDAAPAKSRISAAERLLKPQFLETLGPGLITGAADDDPSGIATYSQAGAQFGLNMLWTVVLTYPLMTAVQIVSARIGRVTGHGLTHNIARVFPRWAVLFLVALLFIANTVNIGADLAAMGAAASLVIGGWGTHLFAILFALGSLAAQIFIPYHRYVRVLKWLTLSLFAYVAVIFIVEIDWANVLLRVVAPRFELSSEAIVMIVAIFGTTISPYLFFWQSSEEVEEVEKDPKAGALLERPDQAPKELKRIKWDTYVGMGFSNLIAFFIILTTAVTLNASGKTDIETSAQAAEALRPIAGDFAFALFSLGIIGTGLLAIPVLAGSAAYAISEALGWRMGLERNLKDAVGFYAIIGLSVVLGALIIFSPLDPIKALFWSAVVNGVISVPIMAAMMVVAGSKAAMGDFTATTGQRIFGWAATGVMAIAAIALLIV